MIVGTPKSDAGTRDIAIPPHLMPLIKEHLKKHVGPGKDALLFPGADGGHLNPSPTGRTSVGTTLRHTGAVLAASPARLAAVHLRPRTSSIPEIFSTGDEL